MDARQGRGPRLHRVPARPLAQDLVDQPARAAQQGDQAPRPRRRHLPQRRRRHPPRRRRPRRHPRRMGHRDRRYLSEASMAKLYPTATMTERQATAHSPSPDATRNHTPIPTTPRDAVDSPKPAERWAPVVRGCVVPVGVPLMLIWPAWPCRCAAATASSFVSCKDHSTARPVLTGPTAVRGQGFDDDMRSISSHGIVLDAVELVSGVDPSRSGGVRRRPPRTRTRQRAAGSGRCPSPGESVERSGATARLTVMASVAVVVVPAASVAVKVTVVVPTGNFDPAAGPLLVTVTPGQLSVAVGWV